jgi:hypothetical protein
MHHYRSLSFSARIARTLLSGGRGYLTRRNPGYRHPGLTLQGTEQLPLDAFGESKLPFPAEGVRAQHKPRLCRLDFHPSALFVPTADSVIGHFLEALLGQGVTDQLQDPRLDIGSDCGDRSILTSARKANPVHCEAPRIAASGQQSRYPV